MPDYRFGISLLSKKKFPTAYNEEIMIDKLTGEILVKTPSGDTISYNYNSRIKSQITTIRSIANNYSIYGDIISIDLDNDVMAPFVLEYDKNYIETPIQLLYPKCKKLLFNADIDAISVDINGISNLRNNMVVSLDVALCYDDGTISESEIIECSINKLNYTLFNLTDNSFINVDRHKELSGIQLNSFMIKNIVMDYDEKIIENTDVIRPILNSLMAIIQV